MIITPFVVIADLTRNPVCMAAALVGGIHANNTYPAEFIVHLPEGSATADEERGLGNGHAGAHPFVWVNPGDVAPFS